jgi:hypothetical protein
MDPLVLEYIRKKYLSDDGDLKSAQAASMGQQANLGMLDAANRIGAALSGTQADPHALDSLRQGAQLPVEMLHAQRQADMQNSQIASMRINQAHELENLDPQSKASAMQRSAIGGLFKDLPAAMGDSFNNMSASDLAQMEPMLKLKEQIQGRKEAHQIALAQRTDDRQMKAASEFANKLQGLFSKGVVKNAGEAERLVGNAKALISQYPDPNAMPAAQINLLVKELEKISSGGVGTEGGIRSLLPNSVYGSMLLGLSKLQNEPVGANAGAFIKQFTPYLDELERNSKRTIREHVQPLFTAYERRLSPSDFEALKADHSKYFETEEHKPQLAGSHVRVTNGTETLDIPPGPHQEADINAARTQFGDKFRIVGSR